MYYKAIDHARPHLNLRDADFFDLYPRKAQVAIEDHLISCASGRCRGLFIRVSTRHHSPEKSYYYLLSLAVVRRALSILAKIALLMIVGMVIALLIWGLSIMVPGFFYW